MFTGIVEERGRVAASDDGRLRVSCRTVDRDAEVGASIAVNGVCLTVVEREPERLAFDVAEETRRRTTIGSLRPGDAVNLERPLTLLARLGGHLVQGHVDGVGAVLSVEASERGAEVTFEAPDGLERYLVEKGSVAVDGVSLTVAAVDGRAFRVAVVPHTLAVTTLGDRGPGDAVNLEMDVVAKYVERFVAGTGRL